MFRSRFASLIIAAAASAISAFAVDGTTLINQSSVTAAGGFPFTISQPGSYKLSSNLTPNNNGALVISASDVTLDLNGFTISCPSCVASTGITVTGASVSILNGVITGFNGAIPANGPGVSGILFQSANNGPATASGPAVDARVEHVTLTRNLNGITGDAFSQIAVIECSLNSNMQYGVLGPGILTVLNSKVINNGQAGIVIGSGQITGNTISANGLLGSFTRGGILAILGANVTNNLISGSFFGIAALGFNTPNVGYGLNTFLGNFGDVSGAISPANSMKNNVGSGGGVF
jgi:hypothetical protein